MPEHAEPFSTQVLIDADMTEHGWEIALRVAPEDVMPRWTPVPSNEGVFANYSDVSDADLPGIVGERLADALLAERAAH